MKRGRVRFFLGAVIALNILVAIYQIVVILPRTYGVGSGSSSSQLSPDNRQMSDRDKIPPLDNGPGRNDGDDIYSLGRYLRSRVNSEDKNYVVPKVGIWPDIIPLFEKYEAGEEASRQFLDEESALTYDFLFSSPERARASFKNLSHNLCWERMDQVWFKCRNSEDGLSLPDGAICPVGMVEYISDNEGLHCPYHDSILTYPERTPIPGPDELYPQLCMGYFNAQRAHRLDEALLGDSECSVKPGETVVDVGCGVGCYTWAMRKAVGDAGKVIACDVDPTVLSFIEFVAKKRGADNVQTLRATRFDPNISPESVDKIYLIDVFNVMLGMEVLNQKGPKPENESYMPKLVGALNPSGKLVIIDFPPEGDRPHIPVDYAIKTMEHYGMRLIEQKDLCLDNGNMYALTFCKK